MISSVGHDDDWCCFRAAIDCGTEWWATIAREVDVGRPLEAYAVDLAGLSPFALGDGLNDDEGDGWGSFEEGWEGERLMEKREERAVAADFLGEGGNVCVCGSVLTSDGDEGTRDWWGRESLHFVSSCGKLLTTGND